MQSEKLELKKRYISVFSLNYFSQGIVQSNFTTIVPIYLLQLIGNVDAGEIAFVMSLVLLPFGVKFIYGILSDKFSFKNIGRRKPWIIGPSTISGLLWVLLPFILTPSNAIKMVLILGIFIVIGVAMADTAIDGLILDLYPKERLGRVQGVCWGFRSVGIIAGGPLLVIFILLAGGIIEYAFIGLGIAMIIFSLLIIIVKEFKKSIKINAIDNLKVIFSKAKNWKVYIFSLFISIVDGVIFLFIPLFILIQWGLIGATGASIDLIGDPTREDLYAPNAFSAFIIGLGFIIGALIGGRMADLQSRKYSVYISFLITTVSLLIFLIPVNWSILIFFAFLLGGSAGWKISAFSAVIAQESQLYPDYSATYYATCNSFTNLGSIIGLELTSILFAGLFRLPTFTIYAIIFLFMAIIINIGVIPFLIMDPNEYEIDSTEKK
ncbi:MAG: MFS transporter [Promethearchaeota archaeon]